MEKFIEIFSGLRERLRNPFFSSFLIAFLVSNWKIWLVIFWHKTEMLQATGYASYLEFVQKNISWWGCLFGPLLWGMGYTLVWPWFKISIDWVRAQAAIRSDRMKQGVLKYGTMPISEFIKRQDALTEYESQLNALIEAERRATETATREKVRLNERIIKYRQELEAARSRNEEILINYDLLNRRYDSSIINGVWYRELKIESARTAKPWISKVEIDNGYVNSYDENGMSSGSRKIEYFQATFNNHRTQVDFVVYDKNEVQERGTPRLVPVYREFHLYMDDERATMEGTEQEFDVDFKPVKLDVILKKANQ